MSPSVKMLCSKNLSGLYILYIIRVDSKTLRKALVVEKLAKKFHLLVVFILYFYYIYRPIYILLWLNIWGKKVSQVYINNIFVEIFQKS